jgi:hypothetical protein
MSENMTFSEIKQEELSEMLDEKPHELKAARMAEATLQTYVRETSKGFDILANALDDNYGKYFWTLIMIALALMCSLAAVKAAGETCDNVKAVNFAVPQQYTPVPVQTPALDRYDHSNFVTKPDLRQELDNAHRLGVMK